MSYQNHVIDPTFFYDALEEFSFNYTIHVITGREDNDDGKERAVFTKKEIRGSLQSQGTSLQQSFDGNSHNKSYNFYCKSLYRINIGDVIEYKNNYLMVVDVQDFDEFGVRSCSLKMIQLTAYRDFADYLAYLRGDKLV